MAEGEICTSWRCQVAGRIRGGNKTAFGFGATIGVGKPTAISHPEAAGCDVVDGKRLWGARTQDLDRALFSL